MPDPEFGSGGKPLFGVTARGGWFVIACVVGGLVGLVLFLGAVIGIIVSRPFSSVAGLRVLVAVAAAGGILGVLTGTRLAWRLADIGGPKRRFVWARAGGILGLGIGSLIPAVTGLTLTAITPALAIACPGIGAVGGLVLCDGYYKYRARRRRKK